MDKPKPKTVTKLNYDQVIEYLEKKYNFESRGFSGIPSEKPTDSKGERKWENENSYLDFWHYLVEVCEPSNGTYIYIPEFASYKDPVEEIKKYELQIEEERKRKKPDKDLLETLNYLLQWAKEESTEEPKKFHKWEQKILDLIFKEFGEHAKKQSDGSRYLKVWVEW